MELHAVIAGLSALREPCAVRVVTDSQYVQRAMTQHLPHWIARGWLNSRGTPVSNQDLWNALLRESSLHQVTKQGDEHERKSCARQPCAQCKRPQNADRTRCNGYRFPFSGHCRGCG